MQIASKVTSILAASATLVAGYFAFNLLKGIFTKKDAPGTSENSKLIVHIIIAETK